MLEARQDYEGVALSLLWHPSSAQSRFESRWTSAGAIHVYMVIIFTLDHKTKILAGCSNGISDEHGSNRIALTIQIAIRSAWPRSSARRESRRSNTINRCQEFRNFGMVSGRWSVNWASLMSTITSAKSSQRWLASVIFEKHSRK